MASSASTTICRDESLRWLLVQARSYVAADGNIRYPPAGVRAGVEANIREVLE
jgi:hypothetical protein